MHDNKYYAYAGAEPYFELVRRALGDLFDGQHFFDIVADNIVYEVRYDLGWPRVVRKRTDLMDQFKGYVGSIRLRSADKLIANKADNGHVIVIEYEIHGTLLATGAMKIGFARSSNLENGRSRTGEITWTRMRPGTRWRQTPIAPGTPCEVAVNADILSVSSRSLGLMGK